MNLYFQTALTIKGMLIKLRMGFDFFRKIIILFKDPQDEELYKNYHCTFFI